MADDPRKRREASAPRRDDDHGDATLRERDEGAHEEFVDSEAQLRENEEPPES